MITVILDEDAPVQIGDPFAQAGHDVVRHSKLFAPGTADHLIAATAITNNAVLIAVDRDMAQLARRFGGARGSPKYPRLHLLLIRCNPVMASKRVDQALGFIEHEWRF